MIPVMTQNFMSVSIFPGEKVKNFSSYFQKAKNPSVLLSLDAPARFAPRVRGVMVSGSVSPTIPG